MKLTDILQDIGRPVAYFPNLKIITGSTTATILLCQFVYWRGKEKDPDGWLYKDSDEIEKETGLSYNEQKTARKKLVEAGLIEEHYARLDHQMRFLVNLDAINEKWRIECYNNGECDDSTFGNDTLPLSLNESETTTETTQEITQDINDNFSVLSSAFWNLSGIPIPSFGGRGWSDWEDGINELLKINATPEEMKAAKVIIDESDKYTCSRPGALVKTIINSRNKKNRKKETQSVGGQLVE